MILLILLIALGAYLVGSIPVAWLLTKLVTGQDMRSLGSGNVGVMNTALSAARWAGLLVFLAEMSKGVLAATIPALLVPDSFVDIAIGLATLGVVIGTRWPIWLGFHGGRGNTAGMAALLLICWQALAITMAVWVILRLLLEKSFIATRLTLLSLPIIAGLMTHSWWYTLIALALSLIYLTTQERKTDDHLIIKQRWSSFWDFLISPPRKT
jgi:glycerol-3-phosphate acyltransferase PlsY